MQRDARAQGVGVLLVLLGVVEALVHDRVALGRLHLSELLREGAHLGLDGLGGLGRVEVLARHRLPHTSKREEQRKST